MAERIARIGDGVILVDPEVVGGLVADPFAAPGEAPEFADPAGRGTTLDVHVAGRPCVQRHYYRGGLISRVLEDALIWAGEDRTRSFVEWRLLAELRRRGLPVPRPVAGRYIRHGAWYTADLITERLTDVRTLTSTLYGTPSDLSTWREVGATIARFHAQRVFHADLNADNIQICRDGEIFLLDFDRGRIRPGGGAWMQRNLDRLRRSIDKRCRAASVGFDERNWVALLEGYGQAR